MAASRDLERTRYPGIFRRGRSYVVVYRLDGRQRKEFAPTLEAARRLKADRERARASGQLLEASQLPFGVYALTWVAHHRGRGRGGFRESTRDDYRRALELYAIPFFDNAHGLVLSKVTPRHVNAFVTWLCDEDAQGKRLSDSRVRNIVAPVRSCLATAVDDGLIDRNPA